MQSHLDVRLPAVAGTFYPASPTELTALVDRLLAGVAVSAGAPCPKAIVAPHAGYVYSGPIAASAFARLAPHADRIARVVLIGPAHRALVHGLASPGAAALRTPLGDVAVDLDALATVPSVAADPAAHAREHSLEVELPFLQRVVPRARVVPLVAGLTSPTEVGLALEALWGGPETVIVISSDLSHYLPYAIGREVDRATAQRIAAFDPLPLDDDDACGAAGINGLVWAARRRGMRCELLDLRSSGDTSGDMDRVVGYGAFALYEAGPTSKRWGSA
jgi:AmmeMemoRadiSam system protein B